MSRLLYRLSYTAMMPVPRLSEAPRHQSPNTESNRRPSPYHGDALPTELLGRARKTLHASGSKVKSVSKGPRRVPRPGHAPPPGSPDPAGPEGFRAHRDTTRHPRPTGAPPPTTPVRLFPPSRIYDLPRPTVVTGKVRPWRSGARI